MRQTMRASSPVPSAAPGIGPALRWAVPVLLLALAPALLGAQERTGGSGDAAEQEAESGPVQPHPEAEKAIGRLKSPFCPGLMLEVCPSPQASELRDTLQEMARSGVKADSLVAWTLARHGEEWRAMPQTQGKDLVAWVVPPVMILLGGALVVVVLRRMRSTAAAGAGSGEDRELSEEEERRLSEALSQMEREGR